MNFVLLLLLYQYGSVKVVIPAKAGIQERRLENHPLWIPAFAGMTKEKLRCISLPHQGFPHTPPIRGRLYCVPCLTETRQVQAFFQEAHTPFVRREQSAVSPVPQRGEQQSGVGRWFWQTVGAWGEEAAVVEIRGWNPRHTSAAGIFKARHTCTGQQAHPARPVSR